MSPETFRLMLPTKRARRRVALMVRFAEALDRAMDRHVDRFWKQVDEYEDTLRAEGELSD